MKENITPKELRAIGLAAFGQGWQSKMARALGVNARTVRRWASGQWPVPPEQVEALGKVLGLEALTAARAGWPRDEWIIGEGLPFGVDGQAREYIVHTRRPRFITRVVMVDEDEDVMPHEGEGEADTLSGVVYQAAPDVLLAEIVWIDAPPAPEKLTALMDGAADALDRASA